MADVFTEEVQAPNGEFNYSIHTTSFMAHSKGIAWVATLFCGTKAIGTVEQEGHGGADEVHVQETADRETWRQAVSKAFNGNEEAATFWLLVQEENRR